MSTVASHIDTLRSPSNSSLELPPVFSIADPSDPRVPLLEDGFRAAGVPISATISYADILRDPTAVGSDLPRNSLIRIDSPGRSAVINRLVFEAGFDAAQSECSPAISFDASAWSAGALLSPRQWNLGFAASLQKIDAAASSYTVRLIPSISDILLAFDKRACHATMRAANLPVPPSIPPPISASQLFDQMRSSNIPRVFIKSRHGSAAAGIIALHHSRGRFRAWTTVEKRGSQLFNSRRIAILDSVPQITDLIEALRPHHVHIERWFPKATLDGCPTDLRILAVGGEPAHIVLRRGVGPMTNLHLGGMRSDPSALQHLIAPDRWNAMLNDVRRAASLFPQSFQISFDVAFDSAFRNHTFFEANAFGDLLKGVLHNGMTTYELQARKLQSWLSTKSRGAHT